MIDTAFYNRQIILPNFNQEGQEKLALSKVLIIGVGGLGCPALQYLAATGIGAIGIADSDTISYSNLHRQILFGVTDIGQEKKQVAAQKIKTQYKKTVALHEAISASNFKEILTPYDIILDTTDNFATRYLINDACVQLNKILVSASVHQYQGQLGVFNYPISGTERSATYRCLFNAPPEQSLSCAEAGVLPTITGLMGILQANEVIKIVTHQKGILFNQLLLLNVLTLQQNIISFTADINQINRIKNKKIVPENYLFHQLNCNTTLLKDISFADLEKIKKTDALLIDVREPEEHSLKNIGGINIPLSEINTAIKNIALPQQVVLYCKIGERSKIAQQRLQEKFPTIQFYNLKGGIDKI